MYHRNANLSVALGRLLVVVVLLLPVLTTCSGDGEGISNFFFASSNNPAIVELKLSLSGDIRVSPTSPLRLVVSQGLSTNVLSDKVITNHVFTSTNDLRLRLTNITSSPIYVLAWQDRDANTTLDRSEPFVTYKNALLLTNLNGLKVYGGATTNAVTLVLNRNYLYQTATLRAKVTYTGALVAQATNHLGIIVLGSTNFPGSKITNLTMSNVKAWPFTISGLTNNKVWLAAWFDSNGNKNFDDDDEYCGLYPNGNSTSAASFISFTPGITSEKSITLSFGDSYTNIN